MTDHKEPEKKLDVVRPHIADGIQEYDNPMPRWWVMMFYFTIVWSAGYLTWYHMLSGRLIEDEYVAAIEARATMAAAAAAGGIDTTVFVASEADPSVIAAGEEAYQSNCMPCHGVSGEGTIGPNLTDSYWLYGGSDEEIFTSIAEGIPEKGMPGWLPILGRQRLEQLTAFIVSLQGSEPANAKAAEGEHYPRD